MHLLFFYLFFPFHPAFAVVTLVHAGLSPAPGHAGFERMILKNANFDIDAYAHYLHHKHFECNYADGILPLDRWFGTFHDGSLEAQEKMKKLSKSLSLKLKKLQNKCFEITKKEFNLNSPKQLSEIFFNELNYPVIKKTPKGAPSTDASVLEELAKDHDLPKHILKYRELEKIRSTYVDGLIPEVSKDSKIHTHYNLFGTTTGRLSSEKPNLQNIPNKTELGQEIRDFFVAKPSMKFILSDYSQIELRVLAHLSQDSEMIKILKDESADIHSETAARIFNESIELL